MKKICYSLLLFISFVTLSFAQGKIITDQHTVIKDASGKRLSLAKYETLSYSGEWTLAQRYDDNGYYLQLVKTTTQQKAQILDAIDKYNIPNNSTIGKDSPNFTFTDNDRHTMSKENTSGQVVVLHFWSSRIKNCADAFPELNSIYEKYKSNKDVVFASISWEQTENVASFLKKHPINYPVFTNADSEISKFSIVNYPTYLVIGKDGAYADIVEGEFSNIGIYISETIEEALDKQ